jgi:hypothetical protein
MVPLLTILCLQVSIAFAIQGTTLDLNQSVSFQMIPLYHCQVKVLSQFFANDSTQVQFQIRNSMVIAAADVLRLDPETLALRTFSLPPANGTFLNAVALYASAPFGGYFQDISDAFANKLATANSTERLDLIFFVFLGDDSRSGFLALQFWTRPTCSVPLFFVSDTQPQVLRTKFVSMIYDGNLNSEKSFMYSNAVLYLLNGSTILLTVGVVLWSSILLYRLGAPYVTNNAAILCVLSLFQPIGTGKRHL